MQQQCQQQRQQQFSDVLSVDDRAVGEVLFQQRLGGLDHLPPDRRDRRGDRHARQEAIGGAARAVEAVHADLVGQLLAVEHLDHKVVAVVLGPGHVGLGLLAERGQLLQQFRKDGGHVLRELVCRAAGVHLQVLDARQVVEACVQHHGRVAQPVGAHDRRVQASKVQAGDHVEVRAALGLQHGSALVLLVLADRRVRGRQEAACTELAQHLREALDLLPARDQPLDGHERGARHLDHVGHDAQLVHDAQRQPGVFDAVLADPGAVGGAAAVQLEHLAGRQVDLAVAQEVLGHPVELVRVQLVLLPACRHAPVPGGRVWSH